MSEEELAVAQSKPKKPSWLRVKLPIGEEYKHVRNIVDQHKLHTICESGNCPNMGECWGEGTATFMILGNICTRSCGFCAVATGRPLAVDWHEPQRVAEAIQLMKQGKKLTHRYVSNDEWITMIGNIIRMEKGQECWATEFWRDRSDKTWETDWSVYGA